MALRNQPAIEILMDLVNRNRLAAGQPPATLANFRVRNVRRYDEDLSYDTQAEVAIVNLDDGISEDIQPRWTPIFYSRVSILSLVGEAPLRLPYKGEHTTAAAVLDDLNAALGTALTEGDIVDVVIAKDAFEPSADEPSKFEQKITVFCNPQGLVYRGCFVLCLVSDTDPYAAFR